MYKELKRLYCVRVFVTVSIAGTHFVLYLSVCTLVKAYDDHQVFFTSTFVWNIS